MKSNRNLLTATLLTAGAVLTAAAGMSIANAQTTTTTQPATPPGPHGGWHHHHRGPWHLLGKLGLSDAQKTQVKAIFTAARPEMESLHQQMHANMQKLQQTQPTDANYSTIVSQVSQTHGSLSAQMLTQQANIRAQIYKILTPAQQTQLATLQAQMAAHRQSRGDGGPPPPAAE